MKWKGSSKLEWGLEVSEDGYRQAQSWDINRFAVCFSRNTREGAAILSLPANSRASAKMATFLCGTPRSNIAQIKQNSRFPGWNTNVRSWGPCEHKGSILCILGCQSCISRHSCSFRKIGIFFISHLPISQAALSQKALESPGRGWTFPADPCLRDLPRGKSRVHLCSRNCCPQTAAAWPETLLASGPLLLAQCCCNCAVSDRPQIHSGLTQQNWRVNINYLFWTWNHKVFICWMTGRNRAEGILLLWNPEKGEKRVQ